MAVKQLFIVLFDIISANINVAFLILGPVKTLRPAFVKVPLDLTHDLPITMLASTVSLPPGTVSEVYPFPETLSDEEEIQQRYLLIHVLDLDDEQALIDTIKHVMRHRLRRYFNVKYSYINCLSYDWHFFIAQPLASTYGTDFTRSDFGVGHNVY